MIKVIYYNSYTLEVVNENDEITFKASNQFEDLGGFNEDFFVVINKNMIELRDETGALINSIEKENRTLFCVLDEYVYLYDGEEVEQYDRNLTLINKCNLEDFKFEGIEDLDDVIYVVMKEDIIEFHNETRALINSMERENRTLCCVCDGYVYLQNGEEVEQYDRNLTLISKRPLEGFSF